MFISKDDLNCTKWPGLGPGPPPMWHRVWQIGTGAKYLQRRKLERKEMPKRRSHMPASHSSSFSQSQRVDADTQESGSEVEVKSRASAYICRAKRKHSQQIHRAQAAILTRWDISFARPRLDAC